MGSKSAHVTVFDRVSPILKAMMVLAVLAVTSWLGGPQVSSQPAPSFKVFLKTLPAELKFLENWTTFKISERMVTRQESGKEPVSKWFHQYAFVVGPYPEQDETFPQKWARQLKKTLTVRKGWKLEFPEVGTYNANATRTSKAGQPDWHVEYRSWHGRSYIFIYDQSSPYKIVG